MQTNFMDVFLVQFGILLGNSGLTDQSDLLVVFPKFVGYQPIVLRCHEKIKTSKDIRAKKISIGLVELC